MATNRYEKPIAAQFMNTYVPIPFEQMVQAGAMKQERYDKGAAAFDQSLANAENINAIPGKQADIRDQLVKDMYDIRDEFAGSDFSDPFVIRSLNQKIRTKAKPGVIKQLNENYDKYTLAQKYKQDLRAKRMYNPALDTDPANDPNWGGVGEIYDYQPGAYLNKEDELFRYFKGMATTNRNIRRDDEGYMISGRTQDDIDLIVGRDANEYASTPSGQDEIKLWRMAHPEEDELGDVAIASEIMNDYAQQWIRRNQIGQRYPSGSGSGTYVPPVPIRITPAADTEKSRQVKRETEKELEEAKVIQDSATTLLDEMKKRPNEYDEGSIEDQEKLVTKVKNEYESLQDEWDTIINDVSKEYEPLKADLKKDYLPKLIQTGITEVEAIKMLDDYTTESEKEEYDEFFELNWSKEDFKEDIDLGGALTGPGKSIIKSLKRSGEAITKVFDFGDPDTEEIFAEFQSEWAQIKRKQNRNLKTTFTERKSSVTQTDRIGLSQKKVTGTGEHPFYQYLDSNEKPYESAIVSNITDPLTSTPTNFATYSNDYGNRKKINTALKNSNNLVTLDNIKEIPNSDGSVSVYYVVEPKEGGNRKTVEVQLQATQKSQIGALIYDLTRQEDFEGAHSVGSIRIRSDVEENGRGKNQNTTYDLLSRVESVTEDGTFIFGRNVGQEKFEVKYENGVYNTYYRDAPTPVAVSANLDKLVGDLVELESDFLGLKRNY